MTKRTMKDCDGIIYEEVTYNEYLTAKTEHRMIQFLEHRYFVEVGKKTKLCDKCKKEEVIPPTSDKCWSCINKEAWENSLK